MPSPRNNKDASSHLKKIRALIVDNDQKIIDLVSNILRELGFGEVFGAQDGFKAIKVMRENKVDLIITDWELRPLGDDFLNNIPPNPVITSDAQSPMAPTDGASFVRFLRGAKKSPNPFISIIMLTGLALLDRIEYARDCGVNEVVIKPISVENLCSRIAMVIDRPRPFITSAAYRGPSRRKESQPWEGKVERRSQDIQVIKFTGKSNERNVSSSWSV